jgi:hypothetical protein
MTNIKTESRRWAGPRSWPGFGFGLVEDKRRRDPGLSPFKLEASVDATVEMGSKGVRG